MKKRVIIIHGWEGTPQGNWFPWLKEQLDKLGYDAFVPIMPNPNFPVMTEWLEKLKEVAENPDQNLYLVGHSLGVIMILRYLESLTSDQQIGGVVLVAGFPEPIGYEELNSFFEKPLDYEKIKKAARRFIAIHSDNDRYVPIKNGELLRNKLNAELIIVKNAGHLNEGGGYIELPIVLEKLKEIIINKV